MESTDHTQLSDKDAVNETFKAKNRCFKTIIAGLALCVIGISVTLASYYFAESGSSYSILYGVVVYGIYYAFTGMYRYLKILKSENNTSQYGTTIVIGVLVVVVISLSSYYSYKFVHANDLNPINKPQTYTYPEYGLKVEFPSGMEEVEETIKDETDSTNRYVNLFATSENMAIELQIIEAGVPDSLSTSDITNFIIDDCSSAFDEGTFEISSDTIVTLGQKRFIKTFGLIDGINCNRYDIISNGNFINIEYKYILGTDNNNSVETINADADAFVSKIILEDDEKSL